MCGSVVHSIILRYTYIRSFENQMISMAKDAELEHFNALLGEASRTNRKQNFKYEMRLRQPFVGL